MPTPKLSPITKLKSHTKYYIQNTKYKLPFLIACLLLLILLPILYFGLLKPSGIEAAWFDDNYAYRLPFTFTHNAAIAAERSVTFSLDTAELITAGLMQADCDDTRFTDITGTVLKYQLTGSCNNAATTYEVVFPSIINGTNAAFVYYGNPSAISASQDVSGITALTPNGGDPALTDRTGEEKSPGPVAYWQFDEGYGTTTQDNTQQNHDGTITNAVWKTQSECISEKCLYFDGTGDYVQVSDAAPLDIATAITVSAWVKPITLNSTRQDIITKASAFEFRIHTDNTFRIKLFGLGDDFLSGTMPAITASQWVHLAATYDGSNINAYVNGILVLTDDSSGSITTNSNNLLIGSETTSTNPFHGYIDDAKVYNYARTAAQIKQDYLGSGATNSFGSSRLTTGANLSNGLVAWWKADENTGTTITDSSGNGNTSSTFTGNTTWATGKFGSSLNFDGTDDVARIVESTSIDIGTTSSSYSVSAWFKSSTTNSSNNAIITKMSGSLPYPFFVALNMSGQPICSMNDGSQSVTLSISDAYDNGVWHQIVCVRDVATDKAYMYLDGLLVDSDTDTTTASMANNADISLGNGGSSYVAEDYTGEIDEVRIYNRALSPAEVSALYSYAPGPVAHFPFDENTGTTSTADISGNGNTGTFSGLATSDWQPGKFGSAIYFDGGTDIDAGSNGVIDNLPTITVSAWLKPNTANDSVNIIDKAYSGGTGWGLATNQQKPQFFITYSGTDLYCTGPALTLPDGVWIHLAVTWNGTGSCSNAQLYLNGIRTDWGTTQSSTGSREDDSDNILLLGNNGYTPYIGTLDDIRIYNYARTSAQIIQDMNGGHPVGGSPVGSQVGYWQFDEGYGDTANDSSPQNNDGDLAGTGTTCPQASDSACPAWTNSGKFNKSLDFEVSDTTDDYVHIPDATSLTFTTQLSFGAWFQLESDTAWTTLIHGNNDGLGYDNSYSLLVSNSGDGIQCNLGELGHNSGNISVSLTTGVWYHLMCTYNGSQGNVYVNGNLISTWAATTTISNDSGVNIGRASDGNFYFDGQIDEVKIYAAALTADQVKSEFNQGKTATFGSTGTTSAGIADNSAAREYCVPGDASTCDPPTLEWKLDENTSTTAYDTSGNGYHGTLDNGAGWIQGRKGTGISTPSNNNQESVSISDPGSGDLDFNATADFTFSFWLKTTSFTEGPTFFRKVQNLSETAPGYVIWAAEAGGSNTILCQIYDSGGNTSSADYNSDSEVVDGKWHQITCVLDRDGSQFGQTGLHLFIDGKLVDSDTSITTGTLANAETFYAGEGSTDDLLNGGIDDVRVYRYARTPAQIAWEYNRGAPIAHYQMDECQGPTIYNVVRTADDQAAGNNGTLTIGGSGSNTTIGTCSTSGAWFDGATGKYGSAMDFDGTDDYISVTSSSTVDLTSDRSIAVWVKPSSFATQGGADQRIIFNRIDASTAYQLTLYDSSNDGFVFAADDGGTQYITDHTNASFVTGQWYHLVGVFDDTNNTVTLYINGQAMSDQNTANGWGIGSTSNLYIGRRNDGNGYFSGLLDDARIYNYALTSTQVKDIMNNGAVSFQ